MNQLEYKLVEDPKKGQAYRAVTANGDSRIEVTLPLNHVLGRWSIVRRWKDKTPSHHREWWMCVFEEESPYCHTHWKLGKEGYDYQSITLTQKVPTNIVIETTWKLYDGRDVFEVTRKRYRRRGEFCVWYYEHVDGGYALDVYAKGVELATREARIKALATELRFWNWRKAARKFVHWHRAKKSSEKDDDALERRWLHSLRLYQQCKEEKKKQ